MIILLFVWWFCTGLVNAQHNVKHTQYGTSPPFYPSPNITGLGGWEESVQKARTFAASLTLEEKAWLVTGSEGPCVGNIAPIPRLNFSGLCLQDGPLAIRQAIYASVFPAGISAAASWDRSLNYQRGKFMAEEFRGKGSQVALGPAIGPLGRSPFGGRNWEGFSPDPYLTGVLGAETVSGMQSAGVQACTKHYIANEQETQRMPTSVNGTTVEALSSNVDDKTMHETYLWPFADAVRAGTSSVMCSYQRINGSYGCQNSKILNGLLKNELGFQGYVVSDWLAVHSGVASIQAGLDMNMPGGISYLRATPSFWGNNITTAVNNGSVSVAHLDEMITRILTPYYHLGQDKEFPAIDISSNSLGFVPGIDTSQFTFGPIVDVRSTHANHIRTLGAAGTVLLKNRKSFLPLKQPANIVVIGNDAADLTTGLMSINAANTGRSDYDIGTLATGGGSGTGRFSYIVSPLEAIKARGKEYGALVQYVTNNQLVANGGLSVLAPVPPDVCIVFLKTWVSEGYDRVRLTPDWNSTLVVNRTTAVCPNTVVVTHGGAPNVYPWRDNPNVTAILAAHLPGQESGNSIVDILWGDVDPSGRLLYTIAIEESDYEKNLVNSPELLAFKDTNAWQADFTEGNLIDYKEFDAANKSVAFEFGFGLSYTTFNMSGINIDVATAYHSRTPDPTAPILPGGNVELWTILASVSVKITNTGSRAGSSVPQLYLSYPPEAQAPMRSLRGFDKTTLEPGVSATIKFPLTRRDLSYWDTGSQAWRLPTGNITACAGFSSRNLPLCISLMLDN
ncbi:avenacinase [Pyrenochaeta sp. DS3sAY3a]|nr:avenacinase [Pyrenochaeta sp. DS3sAY3a]